MISYIVVKIYPYIIQLLTFILNKLFKMNFTIKRVINIERYYK